MATLCRWWTMTPADYWALRWDERCALVGHMNDELAERARQQKKRKRRRRG